MFDESEIIAEMREEYLNSTRPWIVGFSSGKDSTCLVQMIYQMLKTLKPEQRTKTVHVLSTNTMVETPAVAIRIKTQCDMIQKAADRDQLPMDVQLLRPKITDTFWVNLIGRGYPSPNKWFRWCTSRLKIKPMDDYILTNIKRNGEVLILLGTRKAESSSRAKSMEKHEIDDTKLRKHGTIKGAFVYAPLENMSDADVWSYLLDNKPGWGGDNEELYRLYSGETTEMSFIIDGRTPPSGTSRFGCWTCTVVDKDKAIQSLIDEGHDEYIPLRDFRDKLKRIRDDPEYREKYRKNQRIDQLYDEFYASKSNIERPESDTLGPFKMSVRHELLAELLQIQDELRKTIPDAELITPEELSAIELAWIYDGDDYSSADEFIKSRIKGKSEIDSLIDRLLIVEHDMSDVSRRIGIYGKLEKAINEYAITKLSKNGGGSE